MGGSGNNAAYCPRDEVKIWPVQFSPFYQPTLPVGLALTCRSSRFSVLLRPGITNCAEDPVNSATGNFAHSVADLSLPGAGVSFDFIRAYNSLDVSKGPLGQGWTHNHAASLEVKAGGDVSIRTGDGHVFTFVRQADGSFTPPPGALATLTTSAGGYELSGPDQVKYRFDSSGRLTSAKDRHEAGLSYLYDGSGRLSTVMDAAGRQVTFSYDASGNLAQISLPDGRSVSYAYVGGRLSSVTDVRGKVWTYAYEAHGLLEKETDPLGHVVFRNVYDADGRVMEQYDALGNKTTFAWDYQAQTQTVTDARGNAWRDVYQSNVLVKQIDPFENETRFGHDGSLDRTSVTGPDGTVVTMTYDANGNLLTAAVPALAATKTFTYNASNDVTSVTDARGVVTAYTYDGSGNLAAVSQAGEQVASYTYNAVGQPLTFTDARGNTTTYAYDDAGNLVSETDPLGNTTTYTYDQANRLASQTTPLGSTTTYSYDAVGNLTKVVEPRGNVQGQDPDDYATRYSYDQAGRLLAETDPLGHVTTYAYDAVGNRTGVTDANGHETSYAYDARGRLTSVTAPDGASTAYSYDGNGNLLARTDPNGHQTSYAYDAANRMTEMTLPLGRVWTYAYDPDGNLVQTVDANGTSTPAPDDGTTTYSYDRAGRLTGIDYSDSTPDVSFSYDPVGNRTSMTDGQGRQTYAYDAVNRLAEVSRGGESFAYAYDLAGNLTRRTYPDGTVVDYAYDDDSRLQSVASAGQVTSYAYDPAGNLAQTILPAANGYLEERSYDRAGRLIRVRAVKGEDTLADFAYTLDAVGNPAQVARRGLVSETQTYAYDARDRLTEVCFQASCPGGQDPFIRWTYDPVGNRLTEQRPSATTNCTYDAADELTQAGSTSYAYDENGNQTQAGARTFAYDQANRLLSATDGSTVITYAYDGDGNRLQASSGGQVRRLLWDTSHGLPQLALERDGSGTLLRRYLYGPRRISLSTPSATSYYHYDHLGSVVNLTSASGQAQWTYSYEPYGLARAEIQHDPAAPDSPMRFAGELVDASGLYYLRAREYDPALGRFLQRDPLPPTDEGAPRVELRLRSRSPNCPCGSEWTHLHFSGGEPGGDW